MGISPIGPVSGSSSTALAIAALSPFSRTQALERTQLAQPQPVGTQPAQAATQAEAQRAALAAAEAARAALASQANAGASVVSATAFPPLSPLSAIAQLTATVSLSLFGAIPVAAANTPAPVTGSIAASSDTVAAPTTTGSVAAASIDPSSQSALYAQAYAAAAQSYVKLPIVPPPIEARPAIPAPAPVTRVASAHADGGGPMGWILDQTA